MKYKSELIKDIVDIRGHVKSSLHYESECVGAWIEETKGAYPKLCDYESEWLNYMVVNEIGEFPYETVTANPTATINNVVPYAYKSAILNGCTGYLDIDTGEVLDAFEDGRNLELVSVKMPVLTTSNEDGTKTNILTVNEEVTLRGIGDVQDTLDCLTGEVTERINEVVLDKTLYSSVAIRQPNNSELITFILYDICNDGVVGQKAMSDKLLWETTSGLLNYPYSFRIAPYGTNNLSRLFICLPKSALNEETINGLKIWLTNNPVIIQYPLATESIKTVDLKITNQDGNQLSVIKPIEGTMYISTNGTPLKPTATLEIPVEAITQNLTSFIEMEE